MTHPAPTNANRPADQNDPISRAKRSLKKAIKASCIAGSIFAIAALAWTVIAAVGQIWAEAAPWIVIGYAGTALSAFNIVRHSSLLRTLSRTA